MVLYIASLMVVKLKGKDKRYVLTGLEEELIVLEE